jgi:hypothetical protein
MLPLISVCLALSSVPDADNIQQQALGARKRIVTGEIEYDISFADGQGEMPEQPEYRAIFCRDRLIFDARDGYRALLERWQPLRANVAPDKMSLLKPFPQGGAWERFLVRPDRTFQSFPGAEEIVVNEEEWNLFADHTPHTAILIPHPWKFGLTSDTVLHPSQHPMNEIVAPQQQEERQLMEEMLEGDLCWRIKYRRSDGSVVNVWYDQTRDMNVRLFTLDGSHDDGDYRVKVTAVLRKDEKAQVWFPTEVITARTTKGSPTGYLKGGSRWGCERLRMHQSKLNSPLKPGQFERDVMLLKIPTIK